MAMSPLARVVQHPGAMPMVQKILPFALSTAAGMIVQTSLRYTDQRFLLIMLNVLLLVMVTAASALAEKVGLYVSAFLVENVQFMLGLMMPMYLFQFFQASLGSSPAPDWFEAIAYLIVLVIIVLLAVGVMSSDAFQSFAETFAGGRAKKETKKSSDEDE
jgi:hypothetical protein